MTRALLVRLGQCAVHPSMRLAQGGIQSQKSLEIGWQPVSSASPAEGVVRLAGRAGSGDVASPSVAGAPGDGAPGDGDKPAQSGGRMCGGMSQQAMFQDMAGRMEIISPGDVTLVKFLGSGGYGEVMPTEVCVSSALPCLLISTRGAEIPLWAPGSASANACLLLDTTGVHWRVAQQRGGG